MVSSTTPDGLRVPRTSTPAQRHSSGRRSVKATASARCSTAAANSSGPHRSAAQDGTPSGGLAVDDAGNPHATGSFTRTADLDACTSSWPVTSFDEADILIVKMNNPGAGLATLTADFPSAASTVFANPGFTGCRTPQHTPGSRTHRNRTRCGNERRTPVAATRPAGSRRAAAPALQRQTTSSRHSNAQAIRGPAIGSEHAPPQIA